MFVSPVHYAREGSPDLSPTLSGLYLPRSPENPYVGRMEPTGIFCSKPSEPIIYKVRVTTGQGLLTGTFDVVSITLVGINGESPKQVLNRAGTSCSRGSVSLGIKGSKRRRKS